FESIYNERTYNWGEDDIVEYSHVMDPKNNFLHEKHQLVVCCKATVKYNRTEIQSLSAIANHRKSKFQSNQKSLLDSGEFSDFTVVIGSTEIPVHKIILSAHSPIFKAMFSMHTKESQENKVDISDVSVDVMKDFLQFIYTGVAPEDDRLSLELLTLADK
ncbi:PREDICTED: speckle-type POZ protein-like B, partial [Rhagoletis zephyria]|uniref:speckle-type POZ protein-like B n=1 Tax=Rhagoletis zephyria TaxID=28612 RepID=UPI0008112AED